MISHFMKVTNTALAGPNKGLLTAQLVIQDFNARPHQVFVGETEIGWANLGIN